MKKKTKLIFCVTMMLDTVDTQDKHALGRWLSTDLTTREHFSGNPVQ